MVQVLAGSGKACATRHPTNDSLMTTLWFCASEIFCGLLTISHDFLRLQMHSLHALILPNWYYWLSRVVKPKALVEYWVESGPYA